MGCVVAAADPPRSIPFAIARRNHRVKVRQLPNGRPLSIIKAETGTFETARQIKTVRRWAVLSDEEQTKRGIPIPGEYLLSLQSRPECRRGTRIAQFHNGVPFAHAGRSDVMWRDIRFAFRVLSARPGFTLLAAFSLALGIGANSAIFSVIDGMWFRPPGIATPQKLVRIFSVTPEESQGFLSFAEFQFLKSQAPALHEMVAIGGRGLTLIEGDNRQLLSLNLVSSNFFTALGIHAALGRVFTPED